MKQNRIEEILRAIADNKAAYARNIDALRKDNHYSDAGRADLADIEWKKAKQKHESLKDELEQVKADERTRLESKAFNAPRGREDAYHAAIARASAVTDRAQREQMLQLALKTNDTVTLRALAAVSHSNDEPGWTTVTTAAEHDRDIAALVEFEHELGVLRDVNRKFASSYELGTPSKPNLYVERKITQAPVQRDAAGRRID